MNVQKTHHQVWTHTPTSPKSTKSVVQGKYREKAQNISILQILFRRYTQKVSVVHLWGWGMGSVLEIQNIEYGIKVPQTREKKEMLKSVGKRVLDNLGASFLCVCRSPLFRPL